ncbi:MAG: hypothetical protein EAZ76_06380 [Nostocales cyanobacterium]|nr:MAG: hypothetical protein EAZ87_21510 [Nostocales cyanobacterium]TAF17014.1 MAG: hypothetical protein EAZ76_06380 [Nostocales cyanobacterium]
MKFSVKSIYPIFKPSDLNDYQASWEFSTTAVKYLFMADDSQHLGKGLEGNDDFRVNSLNLLNSKPQLEVNSGRYKGNGVP